jgi:hypothetical protein
MLHIDDSRHVFCLIPVPRKTVEHEHVTVMKTPTPQEIQDDLLSELKMLILKKHTLFEHITDESMFFVGEPLGGVLRAGDRPQFTAEIKMMASPGTDAFPLKVPAKRGLARSRRTDKQYSFYQCGK